MTPATATESNTAQPSATPSGFSWYELHTPDADAAAAFYGPVLGWRTADSGMTDKKYTLVSVGETPVGGLLEKPAATFAPGKGAQWVGYIGVDDVSAFSTRVWEAGGAVLRPAEEIPGVGSFAVVADPQGAMFVLFQPLAGMVPPPMPPLTAPGMPVWHDLGALDWEPEFRFYSGLFGWSKAHAMPMGPDSVYQIFAVGEQPIGGMMTLPDKSHGAAWLFYFHVDEIDAAANRVTSHGGQIVHPPSEIPGGEFMAHCLDPQGAIFGIVGPRNR